MKEVKFESLAEDYDLKKYKRVIKRGDGDDKDRVQDIIKFKKLFCVPWLVCYQYLLTY